MAMKILLKKRVMGLGRAGEVVNVRSGYGRNFLIPQGLGTEATAQTMRFQARLQEEARKQAEADKRSSEELAARIGIQPRRWEVKVDQEGHMYGSVSTLDIVKILANEGFDIDRHAVCLAHPIKKTGVHSITLRFPEEVKMELTLHVVPEGSPEGMLTSESAPVVEE